jgi:hypothetical protein
LIGIDILDDDYRTGAARKICGGRVCRSDVPVRGIDAPDTPGAVAWRPS